MKNRFCDNSVSRKIKSAFRVGNAVVSKHVRRKDATTFLVTIVFGAAAMLLIYNALNLVAVWTDDIPDAPSATVIVADSKTIVENSNLNIPPAVGKSRAQAMTYRNGRDAGGGIEFPAFPVRGTLTANYGWRSSPFGFGLPEFHRGLDLGAPMGTPVFAAARGIVTFAGRHGGYGNIIVIAHDNKAQVTTRYGHLSQINVSPGMIVTGETQIGLVGSTGRSTGPHLHYEVRIDNKPVNPLSVYSRQ